MLDSLIPLDISLYIPLPKQYSFSQNIAYMNRSSNECMFRIEHGSVYRAISISNQSMILRLSEPASNVLHLSILASSNIVTQKQEQAVIDYVSDWLDLKADLSPFFEMAQHDRLLHLPMKQFYGLRNVGLPDMFEAIAWGIMGQQINLAFAYTLKRRFVEAFGQALEWDGHIYWIFPSPEQIAQLTVEQLTPLQLTIRKSEYVIGVAKLISEGKLTKDQLIALHDVKLAEKQLIQIRGIGPWTANYVLMRCLRYPDAFPIDDVGLHLAIKHVLHLEQKPRKAEILSYAHAWQGWEAYATFYLWRLLY